MAGRGPSWRFTKANNVDGCGSCHLSDWIVGHITKLKNARIWVGHDGKCGCESLWHKHEEKALIFISWYSSIFPIYCQTSSNLDVTWFHPILYQHQPTSKFFDESTSLYIKCPMAPVVVYRSSVLIALDLPGGSGTFTFGGILLFCLALHDLKSDAEVTLLWSFVWRKVFGTKSCFLPACKMIF